MVIVLMGAAGAGKTTVGRRLSEELNWHFYDADAFHSDENIAKMGRGQELTDDDRQPWLQRLRSALAQWISIEANVVLASSLLKHSHRSTVLSGYEESVRLVYLQAPQSVLRRRLAQRTGHFAGAQLLESQLAALEEPGGGAALVLDAAHSPDDLVREIRTALQI